jgi:hypothetical protein
MYRDASKQQRGNVLVIGFVVSQLCAGCLQSLQEQTASQGSRCRSVVLKCPELRHHTGRGVQGNSSHGRGIAALGSFAISTSNLRNSGYGVVQCFN